MCDFSSLQELRGGYINRAFALIKAAIACGSMVLLCFFYEPFAQSAKGS